MKTKKNTNMALQLPGALALAAAGAATQANAATVQITFTGSFISTTAGNHLVADFGGDGAPEIVGSFRNSHPGAYVAALTSYSQSLLAAAVRHSNGAGVSYGNAQVGANVVLGFGTGPVSARGLRAMTFSDSNIRGGASTVGYLDLTAMATNPGEKRVTVNRLIFDAATGGAIAGLNVSNAAFTEFGATAVPEPSSLGLLALGAGGLLARRRRSQAA